MKNLKNCVSILLKTNKNALTAVGAFFIFAQLGVLGVSPNF